MSESFLGPYIPKPPKLKDQRYFPVRYRVMVMAACGVLFNYLLRYDMNITMKSMVKKVNDSQANITSGCHFGNESKHEDRHAKGDFEWEELTQTFLIASFFWGYICTQIPGGRLAELHGGAKVFGYSTLSSAVLTMFIPLAAYKHSILVLMIRILIGLSQGLVLPSTIAFLAKWVPPLDRSFVATIIYTTAEAGTIFSYPLCGVITHRLGWNNVFYIIGGLAMIWALSWLWLVTDIPDNSSRITDTEKVYIRDSMKLHHCQAAPTRIPWQKILRSPPFWAILIAALGNEWGFYTILMGIPLYTAAYQKKSVMEHSALLGIPLNAMLILAISLCLIGEKLQLRRRNVVAFGTLRKAFTLIAHVGVSICLFSLSFVECKRTTTLVLFYVAIAFMGTRYAGWFINHIDITPNFAGTLFGITNTVSALAASCLPFLIGHHPTNNKPLIMWKFVFNMAAFNYLSGSIFFLLFASGEVLLWNCKMAEVEKQDLHQTLANVKETKESLANVKEPKEPLTNVKEPKEPLTNVKEPKERLTNVKETEEPLTNV